MSARSQDAAGEKAMAGAVDQLMKSATAPKAKPTQTAVTLTVDAKNAKALSKGEAAALNRGQTVLANAFDVTVSYGSQPSDEEAEETEPATPTAA